MSLREQVQPPVSSGNLKYSTASSPLQVKTSKLMLLVRIDYEFKFKRTLSGGKTNVKTLEKIYGDRSTISTNNNNPVLANTMQPPSHVYSP